MTPAEQFARMQRFRSIAGRIRRLRGTGGPARTVAAYVFVSLAPSTILAVLREIGEVVLLRYSDPIRAAAGNLAGYAEFLIGAVMVGGVIGLVATLATRAAERFSRAPSVARLVACLVSFVGWLLPLLMTAAYGPMPNSTVVAFWTLAASCFAAGVLLPRGQV